MRFVCAVGLILAFALSGCIGSGDPLSTEDVDSRVQTAVAAALPSPTPSSTPDIDATVDARVAATMNAVPAPSPEPIVTPATAPTPMPTPWPTATPWSTAIPEPTATPRPTATPTPQWTSDSPATSEWIEAELQKYRGQNLVFSSWGGAYQAAQRQAYVIPFVEMFGIQVIEDSQPTVGMVRAMQESGNVTWHVFDGGDTSLQSLGKYGYLEELDFSIIDTRHFLDTVKSPYIGGGTTWSEVWAYSTGVYPEGSRPQTIADIYDTEKFPGRRAWNQFPEAEIIFVLLSENPGLLDTLEGRNSLAAPNEQQVGRAFELFEEYHDQPTFFSVTGSDCPQSLLADEVDMCTVRNSRIYEVAEDWNSRIYTTGNKEFPMKICWECGHVLNTRGWAIIKGLKEQDPKKFELAQLFMAWTSLPEINARIAQFSAYGPSNTKSLPFLDEPEYDKVRDYLPSSAANLPYAIIVDGVHRAENSEAWRERYRAWQGSFR